MTMRLRYLALLLIAGLIAAPAVDAKPRTRKVAKLHAFESCGGLLRYAHRHGVRVVNDSLPRRGRVPMPVGGGEDGSTPPAADAPSSGGGSKEGSTSPTNVQETGVDEPDIVKAAGTTLYAIAGEKLQTIDASGAQPRVLASLAFPGYDHQLLVDGTKLLVLSARYFGGPGPTVDDVAIAAIAPPRQWLATTTVSEVDVADPAKPRILRSLDVEGAYVSARLAGGMARVIVSSAPRGLIQPDVKAAESWSQVRHGWRRAVRRTRTAKWLPAMVLRDRRTGESTRRALVRCRSVRRPRVFSGLDTISVLTIDMAKGLPAVEVDSVMSDGETVYASPDRLYVASQRWLGEDPTRTEVDNLALTAVHAFDTTKGDRTSYVGSGEVPGYLINQWAMSERDGVLRIATTDEPPWTDTERKTRSAVRTLEERGGRLVQIGAVGGLGEGERIFAVRFIDDTGYVVTFRQTDPLFTIDLSNPRVPRKVGELHVNGYSSYLHPVGDGRLLGIGRDADSDGSTRGLQLSLFDVSDLAHPRRLARQTLADDTYSEAENDHHAFLWWEPERLAVLPVESYSSARAFGGALGFRVTSTGITQVARVAHPLSSDWRPAFRRSVVVGDRLVLVSDTGVVSTPLSAPADAPFVGFP